MKTCKDYLFDIICKICMDGYTKKYASPSMPSYQPYFTGTSCPPSVSETHGRTVQVFENPRPCSVFVPCPISPEFFQFSLDRSFLVRVTRTVYRSAYQWRSFSKTFEIVLCQVLPWFLHLTIFNNNINSYKNQNP